MFVPAKAGMPLNQLNPPAREPNGLPDEFSQGETEPHVHPFTQQEFIGDFCADQSDPHPLKFCLSLSRDSEETWISCGNLTHFVRIRRAFRSFKHADPEKGVGWLRRGFLFTPVAGPDINSPHAEKSVRMHSGLVR